MVREGLMRWIAEAWLEGQGKNSTLTRKPFKTLTTGTSVPNRLSALAFTAVSRDVLGR